MFTTSLKNKEERPSLMVWTKWVTNPRCYSNFSH